MRLILSSVLVVLLSACANPATLAPTASPVSPTATATLPPLVVFTPTAQPPSEPTAAPSATPVPLPRVAVQTSDGTVQWIDQSGKVTPLARTTARFEVGKAGNVVGSTVYAITLERGEVYAIDARGARRLDFISSPVYGFAATAGHGGGTERLAWGTALLGKNSTAEIVISALNGADRKSVVKESFTGEPRVLMPIQWSPDGTLLYYGKEPTGIGGYVLFGGASGLWAFNLSEGKSSEFMREGAGGGLLCIDSIAPSGQWAATHCAQKYIRIVSLSDPTRTYRIAAPGDLPKFTQLGSAEFNPASTRIAYAIALGEPSNERGWVLVSDRLSGGSRLVAESEPGDYFAVVGWLDAQTIVVQSHAPKPAVFLVRADGSEVTKLIDGTFLALMPVTAKP